VTKVSGGQCQKSSQVFENYTAYSKWNYKQHSSGFNFFVVAHNEAKANSLRRALLNSGENALVVSGCNIISYSVTSTPAQILKAKLSDGGSQSSSLFAIQAGALPTSMETNSEVAAYNDFIHQFGTHYVSEAKFGGSLETTIVIQKEEIASRGSSWAQKQSGWSFDLWYVDFGFQSGGNKSHVKVDESFKQASSTMLSSFGGDPGLVDEGDYKSWISSVHTNPVPVDATFTSISELISEPSKARNLEAAISAYLAISPSSRLPTCATGIGPIVDGTKTPSPTAGGISGRKLSKNVRSSNSAVTLPGLENANLGHGYDIKTGSYKLPIIPSFTYDEGKTWYDVAKKQEYKIPDVLDFLNTPSACFLEQQSIIRNSSDAWAYVSRNSGFNVGLAYDGVRVGVSRLKEVEHIRSELQNFSLSMGITQRWLSVYSARLGSGASKLGAIFQKQVESLPRVKSASNARAYESFIKYWGTHVVAAAEFGGTCNFTTTYKSSIENSHNSDYARIQIGITVGTQMKQLGIDLDLGFGHSSSTSKVDKDFKQNSASDDACVGGDPQLLSGTPEGYVAWSRSLRTSPIPIKHSLQLRPISDFVHDAQVKENLKQAISAYLSQEGA